MYKPSTAVGIMGALNSLLHRKERLIIFLSKQNEELKHTRNMTANLPKIDNSINELSQELEILIEQDKKELETNKELSYARRKRLEERIESALPFISGRLCDD